MVKIDLKKVIELHVKWLNDESDGERANLKGANLSWANLEEANLSWANLSWANLKGANLSWANLEWANLEGANLSWANLKGANLEGANLSWANLEGANLEEANLSWANLKGANLKGANLDFSSGFSFRCASFGAIIDLKIGAQMAYHFCRMKSTDPDVVAAQKAVKELANKFHRVDECGRIK